MDENGGGGEREDSLPRGRTASAVDAVAGGESIAAVGDAQRAVDGVAPYGGIAGCRRRHRGFSN